jgi:hypothetical protein
MLTVSVNVDSALVSFSLFTCCPSSGDVGQLTRWVMSSHFLYTKLIKELGGLHLLCSFFIQISNLSFLAVSLPYAGERLRPRNRASVAALYRSREGHACYTKDLQADQFTASTSKQTTEHSNFLIDFLSRPLSETPPQVIYLN